MVSSQALICMGRNTHICHYSPMNHNKREVILIHIQKEKNKGEGGHISLSHNQTIKKALSHHNEIMRSFKGI